MITSTSNDRIKHIRALQARRSARRKANQYVIEGPNLLREAIATGTEVTDVYYTPPFAESTDGLALLEEVTARLGSTAIPVSDEVMQEMSDTTTPQGILGVVPFIENDLNEDGACVLIVDGVSDPGNMGTLMRSAAAARVHSLVLTAGTVDIYNPKVVRSAMGAHFHLPIRQYSWEGIAERVKDRVVFVADSGGGSPYHQIDWTQPSALIVCDEAHGPSLEAKRLAHVPVTIMMPGQIESLNVAIAASIILFEIVRQQS